MSRAAPEAAMTRAIRAALKAGLKVGEFEVHAEGDKVSILTHPAAPVVASPSDDAWAEAMQKWRRSA